MENSKMIDFQQALECLKIVIERHVAKHGEAPPFIVVVGGTAMAARGIRATSVDVDYFSPVIDQDVVYAVETEMRAVYGRDFKIDATPTENLWGPIIFRDLASAEQIRVIQVAAAQVPIKALSNEDLILIKIAADRAKDRNDIPLLAPEVDGEALINRFNTIIAWYGDRNSVMSFADRFLGFLEEHKGMNAAVVIAELAIPDYVKDMLQEARTDDPRLDDGSTGPKKPG